MYNFKRTFGDTFKVDTFSNVMNFIHSYNDASIRLGSNDEEEILAELKGYDPAVASKILNAVKVQFGGVPSRENETQFMRDYYSYMKNTYEEQRAKVIQAQESCEKAKKYQAPNGVNYSAKELAKSGEKAKKKASRFRWLKFALVAAGAIAGSYLLPMVLVNLFAGVASVQAMSAISLISSIAGLVGGGILGNKIVNAGGRKERYLANKELAKYWEEMRESVNQEQAGLQAEEDKLKALEKDFGLQLDGTTSTMESETFNNMYNQYASAPLTRGAEGGRSSGIPVEESEHEFDDEANRNSGEAQGPEEQEPIIWDEPEEPAPEPVPGEGGEEAPVEPEPEEPTPEPTPEKGGEETSVKPEIEESTSEFEYEEYEEDVFAEPEIEEPTSEFEYEEGEKDVFAEPEIEESAPEPETPAPESEIQNEEEPVLGGVYTEPITGEQKEKMISALKGRFTKAINVCSSVGRYMLVDLRESVNDEIRKAETVADAKAIIDTTLPEINNIKSDYIRYEANKTGNNITGKNGTFMQELPEEKLGRKAKETALPDDYLSKNSGQTFFSAVASTYSRQNEELLKKYTRAKYADMTPAQRKAEAEALYKKADEIANAGLSFEEIDQKAEEFQQELAGSISTINAGSLLKKDNEYETEKSAKAKKNNKFKQNANDASEQESTL